MMNLSTRCGNTHEIELTGEQVISETAKFGENVLQPIYEGGDTIGLFISLHFDSELATRL
jgi:hypothetical protein